MMDEGIEEEQVLVSFLVKLEKYPTRFLQRHLSYEKMVHRDPGLAVNLGFG